MSSRNNDSKTFFSQWGFPAILCGFFFASSIILLIDAPSKSGFPGFAAFFQRGDGYFLLIPAGAGILFWLLFSWRIRFEPHYAVIYYCTVFSVRINYEEVTGMSFRDVNRNIRTLRRQSFFSWVPEKSKAGTSLFFPDR